MTLTLTAYKIGDAFIGEPSKVVELPVEVSWVNSDGMLLVKVANLGSI